MLRWYLQIKKYKKFVWVVWHTKKWAFIGLVVVCGGLCSSEFNKNWEIGSAATATATAMLSQCHHLLLFHSQFPNNSSNNNFRIQRNRVRVTVRGAMASPLQLNRFADVANKAADAAGEVIRKYFRKNFDIIHKQDLSNLFILSFTFPPFNIFQTMLFLIYLFNYAVCAGPVTIADQSAEEAMVSIILDNLPSHAMYCNHLLNPTFFLSFLFFLLQRNSRNFKKIIMDMIFLQLWTEEASRINVVLSIAFTLAGIRFILMQWVK